MELVLLRHGESTWNRRGRLTGRADPALTRRGEAQAVGAGRLLYDGGFRVDRVHTSTLVRAVRTADLVLGAMGAPRRCVRRHPGLDERSLGALEGCTKADVVRRWGNARRKQWRDDPRAAPPGGESRAEAEARMLVVWHEVVLPDLAAGLTVLVVAHAGTLGTILGHLGQPADRIGNAVPVRLHPRTVGAELDTCGDPRPARDVGTLIR